jgi:integrase
MAVTLESIKDARQQAKLTGKPVKLGIGEGVRLNISKSSAVFQYRYRIKENDRSVERTLTLDTLTARTDITLTKSINNALEKAEEARAQVKQGIDPSKEKQFNKIQTTQSQALTVNDYFEKWVTKMSVAADWSARHSKDMSAKFDNYISPAFGSLPLSRISRQHLTELFQSLESKPSTYKKVRSLLNMLFEDAVTNDKIENNPVPKTISKIVSKHTAKKLPSTSSVTKLQNMIAGINRINLMPEVRVAALLQAHTVLRSQTVVEAKWNEFDLKNKVWRIPRIKGRIKLSDADKYGEFFNVPLSDEIAEILSQWRNTLRWKDSEFLFPSNSSSGHITIEALSKVYKVRLNTDEHCAHGWRSSFSTLAHEAIDETGRGVFRTDVIERCLDHVVGNEVTQAYNRGELLELRRHLMNWWSKQLVFTNVVELRDSKIN